MSTPTNGSSKADYSSHMQAKTFFEAHAANLALDVILSSSTASDLYRHGPVKKDTSIRQKTSVFSALYTFNGTQSDVDKFLMLADACTDVTTTSGCAQCTQSLKVDVCQLFAISSPNSLLHQFAHSQVHKTRPVTYPPPDRVSYSSPLRPPAIPINYVPHDPPILFFPFVLIEHDHAVLCRGRKMTDAYYLLFVYVCTCLILVLFCSKDSLKYPSAIAIQQQLYRHHHRSLFSSSLLNVMSFASNIFTDGGKAIDKVYPDTSV